MKTAKPITQSKVIEDAIKRLKKASSEFSEVRKDLERIRKFARYPESVRFNVTQVEVYPLHKKSEGGTLKGCAKVELGGQLCITGLRIVETDVTKCLTVEFPPNPYPFHDGETIVFTTSNELREHINCSVIEKYLEVTK
jgi:DNA-binding cell septation regulator SpoVG